MCKRPLFLAGCVYLVVTAVFLCSVSLVFSWLLLLFVCLASALLAERKGQQLLLSLLCSLVAVVSVTVAQQQLEQQRTWLGEQVKLEGMVTACRHYDSALSYEAEMELSGKNETLRFWSYDMEAVPVGNRISVLLRLEEEDSSQWGDGCLLQGTAEQVKDLGLAQGWKAECLRLRSSLLLRIQTLFHGKGKEIMQALLFGEKADVSTEVEMVFLKSGTLHLLTVSGFHFSMMAAGIAWLLRFLGQNPKVTTILSLPILWILFSVEGESVSVERAFLMILLSCLATCLERDYDGLTAWSIAAMLLLLFRPYRLFSSSFLLSFSSVLGILLFAEPLSLLYQRYLLRLPKRRNAFYQLLCRGSQLLAVSISASFLTAPFLLYFFASFSLLSPLASLLMAPLLPAIFALAVPAILLPFPLLCRGLAAAAQLLLGILYRLLSSLAACNGMIYGENRSLLLVWLWLCVLLFLLYCLSLGKREREKIIALYLLASSLLLWQSWMQGAATENTELYLCQRSVLLCRAKRAVIFGSVEKEAQRQEIQRILLGNGVESVDLFLLTQDENAHVSSALDLIRDWKIDRVFTARTVDELELAGVSYQASPQLELHFWEDWTLSFSEDGIVLDDGERKFLKLAEKYAIIAAYQEDYAAVLGDEYRVYGECPLLWSKTWQKALKLTWEK